MEHQRDVGKSDRQAQQVQRVVRGLQDLRPGELHDHMHWEEGVLVEDTPPERVVPDVAGRDLGGVALARFTDMGEFYDDFEGL